MKLEKSIHINCVPEKAFAFASDVSNDSKWVHGYVQDKEILTEGETRVGTRYKIVFKNFGRKAEMITELVAWDPPIGWEYKIVDSPMPMHGKFAFVPQDSGTLASFQISDEFSGLLKLADGLAKGQAEKTINETLQALKKALE